MGGSLTFFNCEQRLLKASWLSLVTLLKVTVCLTSICPGLDFKGSKDRHHFLCSVWLNWVWFAFILINQYKLLKAEHTRVNEWHTPWMTDACHWGPDWTRSQLATNPPLVPRNFLYSTQCVHLCSESTPRNMYLRFQTVSALSKD